MKKRFTQLAILMALVLMAGMIFSACITITEVTEDTVTAEEAAPSVDGLATIHEPEFGGVYIEITIDDFNKLGFVYGDSVDVSFSNGYVLEDIPYYNGYYVDAGDPLLIAYPGYDYIKAAINYGEDLWDIADLRAGLGQEAAQQGLWLTANLDEHSTAGITLRERGKYADIQAARDIQYKDIREEYPSDEVFANFRCMTVGDLKEGRIYRSASPCNNQHKRAPYVDRLCEEAGVNCMLNLADNEAKIEAYLTADDFDSPYFLSLYEAGKVIPLAMNMNYAADEFRTKIADGFTAMAEMEGPYLVHCTEGKDRTGFVCMLIEALTGASYQEIVDDYMLTYDNYYEINEEKDKAKYDVILDKNLLAMLRTVVGDPEVDLTTADLSACARAYLISCGMAEDAIDTLVERLTK